MMPADDDDVGVVEMSWSTVGTVLHLHCTRESNSVQYQLFS